MHLQYKQTKPAEHTDPYIIEMTHLILFGVIDFPRRVPTFTEKSR